MNIYDDFIKHYDDDTTPSTPSTPSTDEVRDFVRNAAPGEIAHTAWAYAQAAAAQDHPAPAGFKSFLRQLVEVLAVKLAHIHTKI